MMDGATNLVYTAYQTMGEEAGPQFFRELAGFDPPYDAQGFAALVRQSPIHHAKAIETPTLLEYGAESHAPDHGRTFFHALQFFGIPSEFVIYPRTGHGIQEPLLRQDSMRRNIEWMDHWVRGHSSDRLLRKWPREGERKR